MIEVRFCEREIWKCKDRVGGREEALHFLFCFSLRKFFPLSYPSVLTASFLSAACIRRLGKGRKEKEEGEGIKFDKGCKCERTDRGGSLKKIFHQTIYESSPAFQYVVSYANFLHKSCIK